MIPHLHAQLIRMLGNSWDGSSLMEVFALLPEGMAGPLC